MKLVKLETYESDGSLYAEHMFWTEKPRAYFCSYDNVIKHTFANWLKDNIPSIFYNEILNKYFTKKVYYFDEQTLDII